MTNQSKNAGNEGDVVKHPALVAALTHMFACGTGPFTFADTYAGQGWYRLEPSGGWQAGIGKLDIQAATRSPAHSAVHWWSQRYLARSAGSSPKRYPGSSIIACDAATGARAQLRVAAWDTSAPAVRNLRRFLGSGHAAHHGSVALTDGDLMGADLVFIDPWSNTEWPSAKRLARIAKSFLIWLPLYPAGSTKGTKRTHEMRQEGERSRRIRREALSLGYRVTRVRWRFDPSSTRDMVGCQLVYQLGDATDGATMVRAAVDEVATLMAWSSIDPSDPVVAHY